MKKLWIWLGLVVVIGLIVGGVLLKQSDEKGELIVFAASSLSDAYGELATEFEAQNPGVQVSLNLASSGSLQIQIEQGALADVFASAGVRQMNTLESKGLVLKDSVEIFALNRLVMVSPKGGKQVSSPEDLTDLTIREICIADPATAPVGQYSAEALKNLNLWESLQDKLIFAANVRQVLQYVEREEVDFGFVYITDAMISEKVEVVYTLPQETHQKIQYLIGIVKDGKNRRLAEKFTKYVLSAEGQESLSKYGFQSGK